MPKAAVTLNDEQFLLVLNRNLVIPGTVESVVESLRTVCDDEEWAMESSWTLHVDFHPLVEFGPVFTFMTFMRAIYRPECDISSIEDDADYGVLENLLATASTFDLASFDWVDA